MTKNDTVPGDGAVQAGDYDPQRNGRRGSRITLLSLDGGGIRGIIPCKMLEYLESELQRLDGPDVRLMDYFDIAAGTSTGGLIAGLLNVLDSTTNRPRFSAKDATSFYVQNGAAVFPQPKGGCFGSLFSTMNNIFNPKYSNKGLEQVLKDTMGDLRLSQAFKEVVVSTFDVKLELPRLLSKVEATENSLLDPLMREACLATSAAPTFLPAVNFQTKDASGNTLEYNCVDGTLVNNNPTYLAIAHAIRLIQKGSAFQQTSSFQGYSDFLVVSLGTGDDMASYQAQQVANWGLFSWIYKSGTVPLWDMVSAGGASMVDYNMAVFFEAQQCSENYLRIQLRSSTPVPTIDDSSASTMVRLQKMADEILLAQEETWNLLEGQLVRQSRKRTNAEALRSMALELSKERKARAE